VGEIFEIYVKTHFSAAHRLEGYAGDCARTHGHNWLVEAYVKCSRLNEIGIGIDFRDIKEAVKTVLSGLDHCDLNEIQPFDRVNPTSENIAKHLYEELSKRLDSDTVKVSKIKVCETPGAGAYYYVEE
jgi:6-pyruvoyltetrahydropterin/6-carboxytetrahydropterin synthase